MWAVRHKSGRVLFVTSDGFIAGNRRKMGWIVEEVKMTSRERFEAWFAVDIVGCPVNFPEFDDGGYTEGDLYDDRFYLMLQSMWMAWQASRAAIEIEQPEFIDSRSALDKGYMVDYSNGFGDAMDAYEKAIEQAGLKVKK